MVRVVHVLAVVGVVVALTASGFAVDPRGDGDTDPVTFDDTLTLGMTGVDVQQAAERGYSIPRAQVFYSQYRYVVGYYGVESLASHLTGEHTARQFGQPMAVLVTDYSDVDPTLTDGGYLVEQNSLDSGWVSAHDAVYVVDSGAKTPAGPVTVPFGEAAAARAFTDRYGGRVVDWETVLARGDEGPTAREALSAHTENRTAWADRQVRTTDHLLDRPVSVVVGEDTPTLRAAVARAPPNTTVRVPPGTYAGNLTVDEPLTIAGVGNASHVRGDGTGTVVAVNASRVAVTDLRITGVGPNGSRSLADISDDRWDERVRVGYGRGDAAVRLDGADDSLVAGVTIETRANGVLARGSDGLVVRDALVRGPPEWRDGFMGVLAMLEPAVVQNVTFVGGRDGVYTHRAHGIVVRDSRMTGQRYGVHEMYTSRALITNNTMRDAYGGVIVMTRPRGNVVRGNDVRGTRAAITVAGSASFVASNAVTDNEIGLSLAAPRSLVTRNVVVDNGVGVRADTQLPSLTVVGNDVVRNDRQVAAGLGPVRIWTDDGRGNYWGPLPGRRTGEGTVEGTYRPSGSLDGALLRSPGALTLRESPAVALLRSLQDRVPGLRGSGVVDEAALARPARPTTLDRLNGTER